MEERQNLIKSLRWWLLDLLFPLKCISCHKSGGSLCDNCAIKIRIAQRETSRDIFALYDYRDPVIKKAIWNLKYYHKLNLGYKLGKLLYEAFIEEISDLRAYGSGSPIVVIPVPISKSRKKSRGYNQAEIIAKGFCEGGGRRVFEIRKDIVRKRIETKPQAKITNRNVRLRNIRDAFEVRNEDDLFGRTVIIIDDVTTTGGTITEIMKVLKNAGVKKVFGFAIAH